MNTISAPSSTSRIRSRVVQSGLPPDVGISASLKPLVRALPNWITERACKLLSAWASVFAQIKSTPSIRLLTMWLTALPPPPPTPYDFYHGILAIGINDLKLHCTTPQVFSYLLKIAREPILHTGPHALEAQAPWPGDVLHVDVVACQITTVPHLSNTRDCAVLR
jgi:hypothetical protein